MNTEIKKFFTLYEGIKECDYGDFMRRANSYIVRMYDSDLLCQSKKTNLLLEKMKYVIQYRPNWDIEKTKREVTLILKLIADENPD